MASKGQQTARNEAHLKKLGLRLGNWQYIVALAGNPNTGKSTVFNALTGLRQHTGNWPGKTVNRAEGAFTYNDHIFKIVDLPGTYSLLSTSEDEEIARNFILFAQPDVTLVVVDATRLERNLNLTLQILEITGNVVVCLNLMDEARRKGIEIDVDALQNELGVPVVDTVARYEEGFDRLLQAIDQVATRPSQEPPSLIEVPAVLKEAVTELTAALEESAPELPNKKWVAIRLLEGDQQVEESLKSGELLGLYRAFRQPEPDLEEELKRMNEETIS